MLHWLTKVAQSQTFEPADLAIVALLVLLEGVLSIDNALVLSLQVRRLPAELRGKALTYGLVGAMILRIAAIALAAWLLQTRIVKLLGGAYLIYLSLHYFLKHAKRKRASTADAAANTSPDDRPAKFWWTVLGVELSDLAFAIDSILAAIALVSGRENDSPRASAGGWHIHPKLWVVVTGGLLGVVLMRFAAFLFVRLIDRFPRFESAAYLLVLIVGAKLLSQWIAGVAGTLPPDFENPHSAVFWIYWGLMALAVGSGFLKRRTTKQPGNS